MNNNDTWNEKARLALFDNLRLGVLGELRLAKRQHEEIVEQCYSYYIEDACPANEAAEFRQFTAAEVERAAARLASEMATWPDETDCDRLDRVEAVLRDRGILLWQVSPCCDTCTGSELSSRVEEIDDRYPGFQQRVRGYAFFIDQNMPEMLAESTQVWIFLAYGWLSPTGATVDGDVRRANSLGIAGEVCECLREHGFEPDWDGDIKRKIKFQMSWQRRSLFE